ncbi:MAG: glycosyltransferase family 9 protein [Arenimonas sp.]
MFSQSAPESVCILRLSALGDATHVLPLLNTLRTAWPETRITWILGKGEAKLMEGLKDVELIVYDKKTGLGGMFALRKSLKGRRFDVLLQMQLALRANFLSAFIPAKIRVGYDAGRSKELHSLFINRRITPGSHHVLDVFGKFCEPLGLKQKEVLWLMPMTQEARNWALEQLPGDQKTMIISPCSSHSLRNWSPEGYAAVARHAHEKNWRVVICGGRSELERNTADAIIQQANIPMIDLVGKDTLKQLLALLERADLLLSPDSGPLHMANAVGIKVIGLYACTDGERNGPYSDQRYCVNHYAQASEKFMNKPSSQLPWGKRIEFPGVMDLIKTEEVIACFDLYCQDNPN